MLNLLGLRVEIAINTIVISTFLCGVYQKSRETKYPSKTIQIMITKEDDMYVSSKPNDKQHSNNHTKKFEVRHTCVY